MINKKVIITGGAGFIGSNLAENLSKNYKEVIIIDNLYTGKIENIKDIIENKNVKFIKGSISDINLLKNTFKKTDYIFHLAAIASVSKSIKDPIQTIDVNVNGTLNVLLAAKQNNVKKVIFSSSCAVYGNPNYFPIDEAAETKPLSPYAASKLIGEYYCDFFSKKFNLSTISLRYFNIYGPKQDPENEYAAVIPKFICRVINNKSPIINGNGEQTRDFTYVNDVIKANILAAKSKSNGFYNIGYGKKLSVNSLAELILKIFNKKIQVKHNKPLIGEIQNSQANIKKAEDTIKYKPKYSLEEGLKETCDWFLKNSKK